jgi:hypothetical protein
MLQATKSTAVNETSLLEIISDHLSGLTEY